MLSERDACDVDDVLSERDACDVDGVSSVLSYNSA